MSRKSSNYVFDEASASLLRTAGSERFRARAVSTVSDLPVRREPERDHRPDLLGALGRPVGRQRWHDHHPRRHPGLPRHHDPGQGHRAQPHWQSHRRRPSDGRPTGRHDLQHPDRRCPAELQTIHRRLGNQSGSSTGITYTPDGKYLLFSQDGGYGPAYVAIASVNPTTGLLSNYAQVSVPLDVNGGGYLTTVTCFPNSPPAALRGPRAALKSPAARPSRLCRMVRPLPIRWASRSRRMARPLTWCWTTTTR
jgi:hypothetical protein